MRKVITAMTVLCATAAAVLTGCSSGSGGGGLTAALGYAERLHNPQTRKVGGDAHLVEWSAEVDQPTQVIQMLQSLDLPGLV